MTCSLQAHNQNGNRAQSFIRREHRQASTKLFLGAAAPAPGPHAPTRDAAGALVPVGIEPGGGVPSLMGHGLVSESMRAGMPADQDEAPLGAPAPSPAGFHKM